MGGWSRPIPILISCFPCRHSGYIETQNYLGMSYYLVEALEFKNVFRISFWIQAELGIAFYSCNFICFEMPYDQDNKIICHCSHPKLCVIVLCCRLVPLRKSVFSNTFGTGNHAILLRFWKESHMIPSEACGHRLWSSRFRGENSVH